LRANALRWADCCGGQLGDAVLHITTAAQVIRHSCLLLLFLGCYLDALSVERGAARVKPGTLGSLIAKQKISIER
jgi:hypothetical protein